jgi:hypothetical protein
MWRTRGNGGLLTFYEASSSSRDRDVELAREDLEHLGLPQMDVHWISASRRKRDLDHDPVAVSLSGNLHEGKDISDLRVGDFARQAGRSQTVAQVLTTGNTVRG